MRLLAGDLGGTNARLTALEGDEAVHARRYDTASYAGLAPIIAEFLDETGFAPEALSLAVAGPVRGGHARVTNLGWDLDEASLSARFGAPTRLLNDFEAQALAIGALDPSGWVQISGGEVVAGQPIGVLGAGTGLGEAMLIPERDGGWRVLPGEGGHARFAPRGDRGRALQVALEAELGRVHVEGVLSGPGIVRIFEHLWGERPRPAALEAQGPAYVTGDADCPVCAEAVEIFIEALLDEAANMALRLNAGAIYIGGGIAPRLVERFQALAPRFWRGQGNFSEWLSEVPVRIITHPDPGLLGACEAANGII